MASEEEFEYSAGELESEEEDVDWEDVGEQQQQQQHAAAPLPDCVEQERQPGAKNTASNGDDPGASAGEDEDWEEVQEDDPEEEKATQDTTDLQHVDWGQVNRALQERDAAASKKKPRRKPLRLTNTEKERELALHQSHLLVLLAMRIKWSALTRSPVLRGLLLSLTTSSSGFDFFADMRAYPLAYSLELLVRWFRQEFELMAADESGNSEDEDDEKEDGELMTEERLMAVFFARKGREHELAVLFAALCRALQLRCRLTSALDPLLVRHGKAFESSFSQKARKKRRRAGQATRTLLKKKLRSGEQGDKEEAGHEGAIDEDDGEVEEMTTGSQSFWLWCEVLDEKKGAWVHADAVRRLVGRPQEVETVRGKAARFSYVVSIQSNGMVVDVTSRYASQWSKTLELRLADAWLEQVIKQLNGDTVAHCTGLQLAAVMDDEELLADEKRRLQAMTLSEGMPTSVEGFRKHHLYCLERHLGQFECLHPRKAVGLFSGQPVFLRKDIQRMQSAFKWRRLGREVKASERRKPAKWHSRIGEQHFGGSDEDEAGDSGGRPGGASVALFGLWQTTEVAPPPVVDGVVPKNAYGNVEVWSPAHVPPGAVHLRLPRIDKVAQSLEVDFAAAVVGFETRNRRTRPKLDGIVVAQRAEKLLLDAHAHTQQAAIEQAIHRNQQLVLRRWTRLTKRLLLRRRLDEDYGSIHP